jgi:hypothetical protein
MEVSQLPQDSESNKKIKNFFESFYLEEVNIDGKKYTYIRMYTISDIAASILPGARGFLERNAGPASEETMLLLIEAVKGR